MMSLERLSIGQGHFELSDINLSIPTSEYGILMGPTGSGKTTLLEAICGLRRISSGRILLDGNDVSHWSSAARNIGYVPQEAVLFPTMRVHQQIGFGLEIRKLDPGFQKQRVQELAKLFEIEGLLDRYPQGLSGGEKQRVALARALAFRPALLCLDEPLSALDDVTRTKLAGYLRLAHQKEAVTVLHITHSQQEADELGTIHFLLNDGQVIQRTQATSAEAPQQGRPA